MSTPLPNTRYRLLVEQLVQDEAERRGQEWGAMAAVARRLQVKPQFLSMVLANKRTGDSIAIERAVRSLPIRSDFFFVQTPKEPHYSDYLVTNPKERAPDPPHWAEFRANYEFIDELGDADLEMMRGFAARKLRIRGWTDWVQLAEWIRNRRPSRIFDEKTKGSKSSR